MTSPPRPISFPSRVLDLYRHLYRPKTEKALVAAQVELDEQSESDREYHREVIGYATLDQLARIERQNGRIVAALERLAAAADAVLLTEGRPDEEDGEDDEPEITPPQPPPARPRLVPPAAAPADVRPVAMSTPVDEPDDHDADEDTAEMEDIEDA